MVIQCDPDTRSERRIEIEPISAVVASQAKQSRAAVKSWAAQLIAVQTVIAREMALGLCPDEAIQNSRCSGLLRLRLATTMDQNLSR
jgi:hypothetical protein